ncbi:uncharacterized protein LOC111019232 [Momordica charantia]|uniref:Large ribosomal subunit protein bL32m n=1 Tax=Momordica charantia TaxID=3673 RepID=A0A6J1DBR3_MOMCH|nr:uncharacterized protein LOC111019232 [Momordica charantia]
MALRIMRAVEGQTCSMLGLKAMANVLPHFSPLSGIMDRKDSTPPLVLPEFNHESDSDRIGNCSSVGFGFPSLSFSGSMELMAVPKRKVSPHKRGIRNGPKALKPIPVIIRCKSCGKVKLPHFYCCSGDRGRTGEQDNSTR